MTPRHRDCRPPRQIKAADGGSIPSRIGAKELYNLRDDVGETKNLAAGKPELARELNELIGGFLRNTEAVVPVRNPSYRPGPAPAAPAGGNPQQKTKKKS